MGVSVLLAVVLGIALVAPVALAKTGKFQVKSWSPATSKRSGILVVEQQHKGKTVNRVFYVPKKVSDKLTKFQPGYIVQLTFTERKKGKDVLARGDASKVKILSSGSGDAFGASAGGTESEARGAGGGS